MNRSSESAESVRLDNRKTSLESTLLLSYRNKSRHVFIMIRVSGQARRPARRVARGDKVLYCYDFCARVEEQDEREALRTAAARVSVISRAYESWTVWMAAVLYTQWTACGWSRG